MKSENVKFLQLLFRGLETSINAKLQVNIDRLLESTHFTFTRRKESRTFTSGRDLDLNSRISSLKILD